MSRPAAFGGETLSPTLAAETLRSSGQLLIRTFGSSMLPAVWPGDLLVVGPAELAHLAAGDLVLFSRGDRIFVHRLLTVHQDAGCTMLTTRGDALPRSDPPVEVSQVLGQVTAVWRNGRPVRGMRPSAAQKAFGWMLRHAGPAYFLLLRLHQCRRRWAGASQQPELAAQNTRLDNPVVTTKA